MMMMILNDDDKTILMIIIMMSILIFVLIMQMRIESVQMWTTIMIMTQMMTAFTATVNSNMRSVPTK